MPVYVGHLSICLRESWPSNLSIRILDRYYRRKSQISGIHKESFCRDELGGARIRMPYPRLPSAYEHMQVAKFTDLLYKRLINAAVSRCCGSSPESEYVFDVSVAQNTHSLCNVPQVKS